VGFPEHGQARKRSVRTFFGRGRKRLVAAGHTLEDARRLIGCVVSTEIDAALTQHRSFDEAAYVAALQRLPTLPWEEEPASS
jgi:hypothetical protein